MSRHRKQPSDYGGATKSIDYREAQRLASTGDYLIAEKADGYYVTAYVSDGRVRTIMLRNGSEATHGQAGHLIGALVAPPGTTAMLVGELMIGTDRAQAIPGPAKLHLFDCLFADRNLVGEGYGVRLDALRRMHDAARERFPDDRGTVPRHWVGRYRADPGHGTEQCPVLPTAPLTPARLADEWERVLAQDLEGLVISSRTAPVNRRPNKLRLKVTDQLEAEVVAISNSGTICEYRGVPFAVNRSRHLEEVGDIVSISHCGYYAVGNQPRFPRIAAVRRDLVTQ